MGFPILAAIENAQNGDGRIGCDESDGEPFSEPNYAQSGADVMPHRAALGGKIKAVAKDFQLFDIIEGRIRIGFGADPFIQRKQIAVRLWSENNIAMLHVVPFFVSL